jgi:hypothetical protein
MCCGSSTGSIGWKNTRPAAPMSRATVRPAYAKAHAGQMAHFAAAD